MCSKKKINILERVAAYVASTTKPPTTLLAVGVGSLVERTEAQVRFGFISPLNNCVQLQGQGQALLARHAPVALDLLVRCAVGIHLASTMQDTHRSDHAKVRLAIVECWDRIREMNQG
jgi:hypothetical protein